MPRNGRGGVIACRQVPSWHASIRGASEGAPKLWHLGISRVQNCARPVLLQHCRQNLPLGGRQQLALAVQRLQGGHQMQPHCLVLHLGSKPQAFLSVLHCCVHRSVCMCGDVPFARVRVHMFSELCMHAFK